MAEGNNLFKVEIVTPDRVFYTGDADMLEFNTIDGQIGVYKHHIPMTTVLVPGVVIIHEAGEQKIAAVHAGFAEILGEKVTLLAEVAEWPEEIDLHRAESARDRAEERISAKAETTDLKRAEFALHKALTRINAAGYK
ncbi:MAG: ATP synthase F1 subunit epsilon [Muribaculaceae bacterium]|nr:ATP synthase F1 subunit epsilon [Roseburia sp.]MCM1431692.1 ATP synthase F1 subunit epsilon [Muribaculaceae bacterium]MCM1491636.1 ATP synthase F1 subunit epsilon [Muribaculaceae bacterium]